MNHVRILIEPEVARLATINATDEYKKRLLNAYEAEHPQGVSLSEEIASGTKVHFILAEMCGNRFLEAIVNSVIKLNVRIPESHQHRLACFGVCFNVKTYYLYSFIFCLI